MGCPAAARASICVVRIIITAEAAEADKHTLPCYILLPTLQCLQQLRGVRGREQAELASFLASAAAKEFVGFVLALNESVKGRRVSDACSESPTVKGLLALLAELSAWVDLIPPVTTSLRYGNPAFREWHTRLESQAR